MKQFNSYIKDIPGRLSDELREINKLLDSQPVDLLESKFLEIHELHEQLPNRKKEDFSKVMNELSEKMESQIIAEKKLHQLMHEAKEGTVKQRKKAYDSLHLSYQQLPTKVQRYYYPQIVHLRQKLEGRR
tara:strand:+ start:721 stop:1110 length:390 start_codon:yes stop_codon:yes gene_type:complete